MEINAAGHLEVGGTDLFELAKDSEFPLYVLDEKLVREKMRAYAGALQKYWTAQGRVFYACKALCTMALCKIAEGENLGLDVASGGEMYTAFKAGFPMKHVLLHGNNKSSKEIDMALDLGVGRIVIDSFEEIDLVESRCSIFQKKVDILVRVQPGFSTAPHTYLATGQTGSKFGLPIEKGRALAAIRHLTHKRWLSFKGLHFHIGSQITDLSGHCKSLEVIVQLAKELRMQNIAVTELDVGGGLGLPLGDITGFPSIDEFVFTITAMVRKQFELQNLELPSLLLEPGRSIVGEAGTTLYTIGAVKEMPEGIVYAAVNGGMGDNIRPCLYGATYRALLANKPLQAAMQKVKVVGKFCEAGDVLIEEILLPIPQRGDVLALLDTGAYHYSMASNYNRIPIPGMVLLHDGKADWIVRPQSYEQMPQSDLLPRHLSSRPS